MDLRELCIEGAFCITGNHFEDERGSFREIFHSRKFCKDLQLNQIQQVRL